MKHVGTITLESLSKWQKPLPRSHFKIFSSHEHIVESKQDREPKLFFLGLTAWLLRSGAGSCGEWTFGCFKHLGNDRSQCFDSLERFLLESSIFRELGEADD